MKPSLCYLAILASHGARDAQIIRNVRLMWHVTAAYTVGRLYFSGCVAGLEACSWKFSPKAVDSYPDTDLSPYSMVVWPADSDNPVACVDGG